MRIIAGKYKGRLLVPIKDMDVRPATDRVKSCIYNILQNRLNLNGARVLDLFAGTGSLGFEALSRGAAKVTFVDTQIACIKTITSNAKLLDCENECEIIQANAITFAETCREKFDLIFADPPYVFPITHELPSHIFHNNLLSGEGFLIIEHSKRTELVIDRDYKLAKFKVFGDTRVSFFTHI